MSRKRRTMETARRSLSKLTVDDSGNLRGMDVSPPGPDHASVTAALEAVRDLAWGKGQEEQRDIIEHVMQQYLSAVAGPGPSPAGVPPGEISSKRSWSASPSAPSPNSRCLLLRAMPDGGWEIMLDFLELADQMRCRVLSKEVKAKVHSQLSILVLSELGTTTWATAGVLQHLTTFQKVRAIHWYTGLGVHDEGADHPEDHRDGRPKELPWHNPVAIWGYLLGSMKIEEICLMEGSAGRFEHDTMLELLTEVFPRCTPQLKRLFVSFEDYHSQEYDEEGNPHESDLAPVEVRQLALRLKDNPYPALRELSLELASMTHVEQASLVRGLAMSGLLGRLEKLTIGGGSGALTRPTPPGPGADLASAIFRTGCQNMRVLWLQRLDVWDSLPTLARALGKKYCPSLEELCWDIALDCDDLVNMALCLPALPPRLVSLGLCFINVRGRDQNNNMEEVADCFEAVTTFANALVANPRPECEVLELTLQQVEGAPEPQEGVDTPFIPPATVLLTPPTPSQVEGLTSQIRAASRQRTGTGLGMQEPYQWPGGRVEELTNNFGPLFPVRRDVVPLLLALPRGMPNLKHLSLPSCSLGTWQLIQLSCVLPQLRHLQILDLSGCHLSRAAMVALVEAFKHCPGLFELCVMECALDNPVADMEFFKAEVESLQVHHGHQPIRVDDKPRHVCHDDRAGSQDGSEEGSDMEDGFSEDDGGASEAGSLYNGAMPPELMQW